MPVCFLTHSGDFNGNFYYIHVVPLYRRLCCTTFCIEEKQVASARSVRRALETGRILQEG